MQRTRVFAPFSVKGVTERRICSYNPDAHLPLKRLGLNYKLFQLKLCHNDWSDVMKRVHFLHQVLSQISADAHSKQKRCTLLRMPCTLSPSSGSEGNCMTLLLHTCARLTHLLRIKSCTLVVLILAAFTFKFDPIHVQWI